jgi:nitric oxide dioxygenase
MRILRYRMLSERSAAVVRATLPVVGGAIDEITPRFYRRMFAAHPKLESDLFNRGNQANGTQSRALAGAVAAFAGMLLDDPDRRPDALLTRIAHKHASLGITADRYPIVHRHLFAAIADVLGDAVTPEVAAAWDEVYWLMAGALIALEARLYAAAGVADGDVWRPSCCARPTAPRARRSAPDSTSPSAPSCPAARARSASTVCRARRTAPTGGSR